MLPYNAGVASLDGGCGGGTTDGPGGAGVEMGEAVTLGHRG